MEKILKILYKETQKAYLEDEIPIAAVITQNGKIIAKSHNNRQHNHDVCGHAEILAIRKAAKKTKNWNLQGMDLYVTLEPCEMCLEVIKQSRLNNVYYFSKRLEFKKEYSKTKFHDLTSSNFEANKQFAKTLKNYFKNKR